MPKTTTAKPMISIERNVTVRRAYSVPESIASLLDDYAAFLSEIQGAKVTPGDIVGKLAARLAKDGTFIAWKANAQEAAKEH